MMLSRASPRTRTKFSVSQNGVMTSTVASRSAKPTMSLFVVVFIVALVSLVSMVRLIRHEKNLVKIVSGIGAPKSFAFFIVRVLQSIFGVTLLAALSALYKALSQASASTSVKPGEHKASVKSDYSHLSERQRVNLGLSSGNQKTQTPDKSDVSGSVRQRPPRARASASPSPSTQSSLLVPVHPSSASKGVRTSTPRASWAGMDWVDAEKVSPATGVPAISPSYAGISQSQTSPVDSHLSPWKKSASPLMKENISSEDKLNEFLADVEDKMVESSTKNPSFSSNPMTPPPTLRGVTVATPTSAPTPSSASKSTPIRTIRISPSPQKFAPSPTRKNEGEIPSPMSMEQAIEAFQKLNVYPQIEQWRDQLRQWFSKHLLNPLVNKVDMSHLQVMQAAAKLGISINVNPIGGNKTESATPPPSSLHAPGQDWVSTFSPDEDSLLHQLRAYLVQARDAPPLCQPSTFGLQQHQVRMVNPAVQECLDAVSEHQRLKALMKGEWAKGLLPQSSVRADYTVQRIRELAEGTCVKKYEYLATGELYDKIAKKWTLELPTDSHLLMYLFCALLEHPNWMLHIDAGTQPNIQSNNPLFIANIPQKERCPEKYIAVLPSAPSFLQTGACVLAVGKQNPPVFALYWDKKFQLSLQGRTALWDAVLLLCHRIKSTYGGVVQGINLGSSAFNLLSVFDIPEDDEAEQ